MNERYFNAYILYSYVVCKREAWFYYHGLTPSPDHTLLDLGRLIHEISYRRDRKEVLIDGFLKLDVIKNAIVAEVKKSSRKIEAARLQLAYYLYYLKKEKDMDLTGVLLFPKERKKEKVILDHELERKIEKILDAMRKDLSSPIPPKAVRTAVCKVCSFYELCWV